MKKIIGLDESRVILPIIASQCSLFSKEVLETCGGTSFSQVLAELGKINFRPPTESEIKQYLVVTPAFKTVNELVEFLLTVETFIYPRWLPNCPYDGLGVETLFRLQLKRLSELKEAPKETLSPRTMPPGRNVGSRGILQGFLPLKGQFS